MKNLIAILLIGASIGIVFTYALPAWDEVQALRLEEAKYSQALDKVDELSAALEQQRNLIASIPAGDLERLEKLLPDNVDNVQLIIDINNIASTEGLAIRNIEIATPEEESTGRQSVSQSSRVGYDFIDLKFNVSAQYPQFINFITALEQSLRLVDIVNVSFVPGPAGAYEFSVTLRTYWLK